MELALLLPLMVLCGFIFSNKSRTHFYKLHRFSDQFLYLKIAKLGFYIVFFSAILTILIYQYSLPSFIKALSDKVPSLLILQFTDLMTLNSKEADIDQELTKQSIQLKTLIILMMSATSILVSFIAAFAYNFHLNYPTPLSYLINKMKLYLKLLEFGILTERAKSIHDEIRINTSKRKISAKLSAISKAIQDRPLDLYFLSASRSQRFVLITLDTGKVYVGTILSPGEVNESEGLGPEIMIYPIASGYRDTTDQQLTLTTEYPDSEENAVFIKMDRITTVSNFDPELYNTVKPTTS